MRRKISQLSRVSSSREYISKLEVLFKRFAGLIVNSLLGYEYYYYMYSHIVYVFSKVFYNALFLCFLFSSYKTHCLPLQLLIIILALVCVPYINCRNWNCALLLLQIPLRLT